MASGDGKSSVVVVVEGGSDYESVRSWLADSTYISREAADAVDAVDELCDFTMSEFPDVVILDTRNDKEPHDAAEYVRHLSKGVGHDIQIVSYSPDRTRQCCLRDIRQLDGFLNTVINSGTPRAQISHA